MGTEHGPQPDPRQPAVATRARPDATLGKGLRAQHVPRDGGILLTLVVALALVPPGCRQVQPARADQGATITLSPSDRARVQSWLEGLETRRGSGYEAIALVSRDAEDASLAALFGFLGTYNPLGDTRPGRPGIAACVHIVESVLPYRRIARREKRIAIAQTEHLITKWQGYASSAELSLYRDPCVTVLCYLRLFHRKLTTGEPIPVECGG